MARAFPIFNRFANTKSYHALKYFWRIWDKKIILFDGPFALPEADSNGVFALTEIETETDDIGFYGIAQRCSYCTETHNNTNSYRVLYASSQSRSLAV